MDAPVIPGHFFCVLWRTQKVQAMKNNFLFCLFTSLLLSSGLFAQNLPDSFPRQWKEIDSLLSKQSLPKSALAKVNALYKTAYARKNEAQVIKALIYTMYITDQVTDKEINSQVATLQQEINKSFSVPQKSILLVLKAKVLAAYYANHQWQIRNRKETSAAASADITEWTSQQFAAATDSLYQTALSPVAVLQRTALPPYDAIIEKGNVRYLRPTLYDLLAWEVLEYHQAGGLAFRYDESSQHYAIPKEALLPAQTFVDYHFPAPAFAAHQWQALRIYQQLLAFHLRDSKPGAMLDADINRISWIYNNSNFDNKDSLYLQALKNITYRNGDEPEAAQAYYLQAAFYSQKAQTYVPLKDTTYRYHKVIAKELIERQLSRKLPESEGSSNMQQLLREINSSSIRTQVEGINVPDQPFRLQATYKNVPILYGKLIRFNALNDTLNQLGLNDEETFARLLKMPAYRQFIQPLPVTNDYQEHTTEIKVDALPPGRYLLIASSSSTFNKASEQICVQAFDVSTISYLRHDNNYFILNRETGQPLEGARMHISRLVWNRDRRKYDKKLATVVSADKNGRCVITLDTNGEQKIMLTSGKDTLQVENEYYYREVYPETKTAKITTPELSFFTDRGIYRPGQVVYFKGIAYLKQKTDGKPSLYTSKDSIKVILYNTSSAPIDSLSAIANEYGSIAGRFTVPAGVLTGDFHISASFRQNGVKETKGYTSFKVEEYKRPTFYVTFDTLASTYRLNDTITITGHAKAYAGNTVNGATVAYKVTRSARFPYPWLFRGISQPYSKPVDIITGTATTDATGAFTLKFPATPDPSVAANTLPVFNFAIEASVTGINGETREGNSSLAAGYHALTIQLSTPSVVEAEKFTRIQATVKNLSGKNVNSIVQITVYPLQSPGRLIRKRYWGASDQFTMSYDEYVRQFPHDEYGSESDYQNWPRLAPVAQGSFSTDAASTNSYVLAKPLPEGRYLVEAKVTEPGKDTLKDLRYVQVFQKQAPGVPALEYDWSYQTSSSLAPGDTAKILSGSAASDVYVIRHLRRGEEKTGNYSYSSLNKEKKATEIRITDSDKGGIGFSYAFVKHNRVYNRSFTLNVPYSDKSLSVVYETFRNKTQPGSKETWSVKVSGAKGEKVAAELLTAMYDASLDQFTSHDWSNPSIWPSYAYNSYWNTGSNFNPKQSSSPYFSQGELPVYYSKIYDQLKANLYNYLQDGYVQSESFVGGGRVQREAKSADVAVMGFSSPAAMAAPPNQVRIRGAVADTGAEPLYVIDGVVVAANNLSPDQIAEITILKDASATSLYGARGANGVVVITTKEGKAEQAPVQIRKNFNETAFFFPQLHADDSGSYTFSFTTPEALTQWKWLSLAHTKDLAFGAQQQTITTQKTVMAQVNAPRFVRQGDQLALVASISNLDSGVLSGTAKLELLDAITNEPIDNLLGNHNSSRSFTVAAGQTTPIRFEVKIPGDYHHPVTYRIVARAGNYSDGEENTIPVLSNRMLVTETVPLLLKGNSTRQFSLDKLVQAKSNTLTTESVTVEYTTNPIWQAIQALPYLAEYPYECAEQTFNRFYANTLASFIVNKYPQIKTAFELWKKDTTALQSNLQQNETLKQILLEETPWVLQAESEAQRQKNIALLFDMVKLSQQTSKALQQLQQMQLSNGSFSWFKGGNADRYITNYIITGIGKLQALKALSASQNTIVKEMVANGIAYLDDRISEDYKHIVTDKTVALNNLSTSSIQYLFARSYFKDISFRDKTASQYFLQQAGKYWMKQNNYNKALLGVVLYRNNQQQLAAGQIFPSILENAVEDSMKGMYWKDRITCFWHPSPIEHQATIMLLAAELNQQKTKQTENAFNDMRTWLILNKQTNHWGTTIATADAIYALLAKPDALQAARQVTIQLGTTVVSSGNNTQQAGTGYFKQRIDGAQVTPAMGNITVITRSTIDPANSNTVSYGAVYWQYFEDMDKISSSAGNPLTLTKKWFIQKQNGTGTILEPLTNGSKVTTGDKVVIQLVLKSDRDMDYVHVKDMRAASMEPVNVLSGYKWMDGLGYYEATKDASTNFFIDHLRKGTYVFDYPVYISHTGVFTAGIATAQCMYAPEFNSHSEGMQITVTEKK